MGCDMASDSAELRAIAEPNTILRGLVGSSVHGLVLDGTDDRDEMGVCVEPRRYVLGFGKFEQWVYRSAAEREGDAGARSCAGDLDLNMYSLRKWARLALQGNSDSAVVELVEQFGYDTKYAMLRPHRTSIKWLRTGSRSRGLRDGRVRSGMGWAGSAAGHPGTPRHAARCASRPRLRKRMRLSCPYLITYSVHY